MLRNMLRGVLLLFLLSAVCSAQVRMNFVKVAEGIYVASPPNELRFDDSNSTIIVLDDGVLVIDTQVAPDASRAVIAGIVKLTDRPVRWVVNSHWHGDHVQGNSAYREAYGNEVQFIAHVNARRDIEARAMPSLKEDLENIPKQIEAGEKQLASGLARSGAPLTEEQKTMLRGRIDRRNAYLARLQLVNEFVLPEMTFETSLTIFRGGREIRLIHFPGHTQGDVAAFLPKERILFTGDLCDDLPYTGHGSPAALVKTLGEFEKLDFEVMIPGHGAPKNGKEHLRMVRQLFESIVSQTEAAARAGLSLEDTMKKVDVSSFKDTFTHGDDAALRYWGGFIPDAVERAWKDVKGQP